MTRTSRFFLSSTGLLALAFCSAPSIARADDLQACVKASESAQSLRDEGKYRRAREQLLICSRDTCPNVVRKDCAQWLTEVDESTPSVVVSATDNGHDVIDVKVTVDGALVASKLEGKPFSLDPGAHTLHYEHAGEPPIDDQIVVRAGEKNRLLKVNFGTFNGGGVGPGTAASTPQAAPEAPHPPSPVAYVLGGVGVLGIASWAFFGLTGKSDVDAMRSSCGVDRTCSQSAVDHARTKLLVADISLGVGIAGLASGAIVFFTTRKSGPADADTGASAMLKHFDFHPAPGGGMGTFAAKF